MDKLPTWPNSRICELLSHRWQPQSATACSTATTSKAGQYGLAGRTPKAYFDWGFSQITPGPAHTPSGIKFM